MKTFPTLLLLLLLLFKFSNGQKEKPQEIAKKATCFMECGRGYFELKGRFTLVL